MLPEILLFLMSSDFDMEQMRSNRLLTLGYSIFLSVQGDGLKIPGLVKSMNFQWSTAKSPKISGGWQHFATKFIEIEIFILTDFSRQSCHCKQEFQGKKGKKYFPGG